MKTCLAFVFSAVFAFTIGVGPAAADTKIALGPKLGINAATMTGEELEAAPGSIWDPGYMPGGMIGVFASFAFTDKWAIQPEVLYSQKGSDYKEVAPLGSTGDTTRTTTANIELMYVEVPVLLTYTLPRSGRFQPFFYAGPVIAFNVSSSFKVDTIVEGGGKKLFDDRRYSSNIHNAKSIIIEGTV
jgi:hypothetical protein